MRLDVRVSAIDTHNGHVEMEDGTRHAFGALLLATGAEPVRLDVPGANLPHVHYLRSVTDSRGLVSKALASRRAVVIGASFIGLEVAASLRARNVEVHVVGREAVPMEHILGLEVGNFIRNLHEKNGVTFHLGATATSIDERSVALTSGETLQADLVVIGIGVRPQTELAERAGLATDRGVIVNKSSRRAPHASSQPATSRAGQTGSPANESASNILSWPSARDRRRRATFLASANALTLSRSSGLSSTTSALAMSDTQSAGTKPKSTDHWTGETVPSPIGARAKSWQSPSFIVISKGSVPKSNSNEP